jgi:uncharacterized protein (DUF885 family)
MRRGRLGQAQSQPDRSPELRMTLTRLSAALLCALLVPAAGFAAAPLPSEALVPPAAEHAPSAQLLAPLIQRFRADMAAVEHVHDIAWGEARRAALDELYRGWVTQLEAMDFEALGLEDRVDWILLNGDLGERLRGLEFERERLSEATPLLPEISALIELAEARRALKQADGRSSAGLLERARLALAALDARIEAKDEAIAALSPAVAHRAARILDSTRAALKEWHAHQDSYDPDFTHWLAQPWPALDAQLTKTADLIRKRLAGVDNPEVIIGDPIGREALIAALTAERIPYTPEQLVEISRRELAWCREELSKAAREMGFDDWREALEAVKQKSPPVGQQPQLVVELANEAIEYLTDNQLVSVPELSRRDWRMNMLSPQAQLQAPFFLGGRDVWVAYPHSSMPHEKQLMSLRGNNRHFSRAVVHHELIPGHHLQYFYNLRHQTHRQLFRTPFWGEGWALYWELFLYQRGFAQTPEDRIGMLFWRSHRAARIQFSLGFHLGTMTPQQAIELLVNEVGHERENAAAEVRRSFTGDYGPLYQAAYLLGGLQLMALRKELVESGRMDERSFHDAILKGGTMPIDLVRMRLRNELPAKNQALWRWEG